MFGIERSTIEHHLWRWDCFLLLASFALDVSGVKICELRDSRVFCQCDGYEVDKVRTVSCNFPSNVTGEDEIWTGFEEQRMVETISLNGRGEGSLTTVPVRAFRITKQVREVTFTGNRLGVLQSHSFADMDQLIRLDLSQNEIAGLQEHAFNNLPNLTTLILSDNAIRVIPSNGLQHMSNLKELFLDRNEIEVIADHAFQHLHKLVELDLTSNHLTHISSKTFVGLRALRRLDLSRNSLVSLKDRIFRSSDSLADLDLSRNRISEITPHAFDGLKHLQTLSLKDNKLFNLQKTVFKGAPHLLSINLADNKLVMLQKHILDPLVNASNSEFVIILKGNPFECRCDMLWIASFVNNSKTHSESLALKKEFRSMKCTFGEYRKANLVSVVELKRDEMTCPDPPVAKPQAPVYHPPPHHTSPLLQKPAAPSTTTTTVAPVLESSTASPDRGHLSDELPFVQTPPEVAEVNHVEVRDEMTTARAQIARETKGTVVNREQSDAAESAGFEPKPKTAEKKVDNTSSGSVRCPCLLQTLFVFALVILNAHFKGLNA